VAFNYLIGGIHL